MVAMATSLEESEKLDRIEKSHANTFHLVVIVEKNKVEMRGKA